MCICSVFAKYSFSVEEKLTESNKDTTNFTFYQQCYSNCFPTVLFSVIRANEYRFIVKKCYLAGITFD